MSSNDGFWNYWMTYANKFLILNFKTEKYGNFSCKSYLLIPG